MLLLIGTVNGGSNDKYNKSFKSEHFIRRFLSSFVKSMNNFKLTYTQRWIQTWNNVFSKYMQYLKRNCEGYKTKTKLCFRKLTVNNA